MEASRLITAVFFFIFGIGFMFLSLYESLFLWIFSLAFLTVGFVILFNKNEDKIEQRKDIKIKHVRKKKRK